MAHRMQITLRDDQYESLRHRSATTGLSVAEIIRRALDREQGRPTKEERLRILRDTAGAWPEYPDTGAEFVERMRPGVAARLRKLGA